MKEAKPFVIDPKVMSMHKELSVKSRVRGDFHARFCERVRVKHPRSTRPWPSKDWGREKDEDEIEWIRRCLRQATKMIKPMKRKGLCR